MRVENEKARKFYADEAVRSGYGRHFYIDLVFYNYILKRFVEDNLQIFASKYKLYLPTEEELCQELKAEYEALEEAENI